MNQQQTAEQQWQDIANEHYAFLDRCTEIAEKLGGDKSDTRPSVFFRLRGVGRSIATPAIRANQVVVNPDGVPPVMFVWGLGDQNDLPHMLYDIGHFAKVSLITLVQFYLENMIHTVLEVHPKAKDKFTFKKATKEILRVARLDNQKRKLTVLNLLAILRNTMHREGVYKWEDQKIVVGKFEYEFLKGNPVLCSSWPHVYNALQASLDIYEEILLSEEIVSLEHVPLVA